MRVGNRRIVAGYAQMKKNSEQVEQQEHEEVETDPAEQPS